jgi:glycosyltransferase involved in cell wall biosynthesis
MVTVRPADSCSLNSRWVCCQLGAREHYAIARALFRLGVLEYLLTDVWVPPSSLVARVCGRSSKFAHRFHSDLHDARVKAFNSSFVLFEMLASVRHLKEWPKILARNQWFQRKVVTALSSDFGRLTSDFHVLLSYSYAALGPFRYAKTRGWKTVLVQIDPGPEEEKIVAAEVMRVPDLAGEWQPAPPEYWACWREECKLADRIIVNSEWSREGLVRAGVPAEKISIIPLAYEASAAFAEAPAAKDVGGQKSDVRCARKYPVRFTHERPLRVLFLGLINLRKGVARLLEAARILRDEAVEFWLVGPVEIASASTTTNGGHVKWFGPVTRNQATGFYRNADLFILPTLSDGFAITQLEAQAHGLPVIVSKSCGKVVENGLNGIILEEPSATCIAAAVRDCIADPDRVQRLALASRLRDKFTIQALARELQHLGETL